MFEPTEIISQLRELNNVHNVIEIGVGTCKNLFSVLSQYENANIYGCDKDSISEIESTTSFYMQGFEFYTENIGLILQDNHRISRHQLHSEFAEHIFNSKIFTEYNLDDKLSRVRYEIDYKEYLNNIDNNLQFDLIILARVLHYEEVDISELMSRIKNKLTPEGIIFISYPTNSGRNPIITENLIRLIETFQFNVVTKDSKNKIELLVCKKT